MGCTQEAIEVFENTRNSAKSLGDSICWYAPGKAANAGGVAVSGVSVPLCPLTSRSPLPDR